MVCGAEHARALPSLGSGCSCRCACLLAAWPSKLWARWGGSPAGRKAKLHGSLGENHCMAASLSTRRLQVGHALLLLASWCLPGLGPRSTKSWGAAGGARGQKPQPAVLVQCPLSFAKLVQSRPNQCSSALPQQGCGSKPKKLEHAKEGKGAKGPESKLAKPVTWSCKVFAMQVEICLAPAGSRTGFLSVSFQFRGLNGVNFDPNDQTLH